MKKEVKENVQNNHSNSSLRFLAEKLFTNCNDLGLMDDCKRLVWLTSLLQGPCSNISERALSGVVERTNAACDGSFWAKNSDTGNKPETCEKALERLNSACCNLSKTE